MGKKNTQFSAIADSDTEAEPDTGIPNSGGGFNKVYVWFVPQDYAKIAEAFKTNHNVVLPSFKGAKTSDAIKFVERLTNVLAIASGMTSEEREELLTNSIPRGCGFTTRAQVYNGVTMTDLMRSAADVSKGFSVFVDGVFHYLGNTAQAILRASKELGVGFDSEASPDGAESSEELADATKEE